MINKAMIQFYKEIGDMALSKPERDEVKLLIIDMFKEYHEEHVKNCPHAIKMQYNWKLAAAVVVAAALGSSVSPGISALAKFFM